MLRVYDSVVFSLQLIERTVVDHPHHTLFIILALANAAKDEEALGRGAGGKKGASGRLSRSASQITEQQVSSLL